MARNDQPIIVPRRGRSDPCISPTTIIVFTKQDWGIFSEALRDRIRERRDIDNSNLLNATYYRKQITVVGPIVGAPQAVLIFEKLVALGATSFLAIGWCGSINPEVRIGHIVVPVGTRSEEGTSKHYPLKGRDAVPSKDLVTVLKKNISSKGLVYHEGLVWTTDAPYRETVGKVLKYQKEGVLAVDMETSALFHVAAYRGVRIAIALIVSDELFTLKWRHGFKSKRFVESRHTLATTILEIVEREY